jgi:hypothetical protein
MAALLKGGAGIQSNGMYEENNPFSFTSFFYFENSTFLLRPNRIAYLLLVDSQENPMSLIFSPSIVSS